jgi:YidC/Oxa1 family membrane protein insertase
MDKRSLIAIALSLAVFMAWDYFYLSKQKGAPVQPSAVVQTADKGITSASVSSSAISEISVSAPRKTAGKEEKTSVETSTYSLVLSNKGGKIESLLYGSRKVELVNTRSPLTPNGFDFPIHFSEKEFRHGSPIQDSFWTLTKKNEKDILFSIAASVNNIPVIIEKEFLFNEKEHYFDVIYRVKNTGRTAISFENNSAIVSPADGLGPVMSDATLSVNMLNTVYNIDGSFKKGARGGGMFSEETDTKSAKGKTNWYGIISRYFTVIMIPQSEEKASGVIYDSKKEGSHRIGGFVSLEPLQPNAAAEKKFRICVAEKEKDILATVDPGIVEATDVSKWTEPLRVGILWCLLGINKLFGNLGLSIIVLSMITKCIFLPLTIKSTNSMKKMSQLAPQMTEIKEKYKDNPEKVQKATMELYKKNGVNPMSGCLPILVQMPFFIALYSALSSSFALYGSPFCLWIKDLSMPDSVYTFHAIGTSLSLNILPVVMTITTYIQQKMSSMDNAATGAQAVMMKMMPLLFIFMFWSMPSGLTLYWSVQNLLQIAHQTYVNRVKKSKPVVE